MGKTSDRIHVFGFQVLLSPNSGNLNADFIFRLHHILILGADPRITPLQEEKPGIQKPLYSFKSNPETPLLKRKGQVLSCHYCLPMPAQYPINPINNQFLHQECNRLHLFCNLNATSCGRRIHSTITNTRAFDTQKPSTAGLISKQMSSE